MDMRCTILILGVMSYVVLAFGGPRSSILQVDLTEKNLLEAIKIPFDSPETVFFDPGADGFPAMGLRRGSDIKSPFRLFLPEKFYPEFSIIVMCKLVSKDGGFLFAVVNPLETVVELGVHIGSAGPKMTNISLLYTDINTHFSSETIASFIVPSDFSRWTQFALKVTADKVTLYFKCEEYDSMQVKREPQELVFDSASTLYIGQAGPIIKGSFEAIGRRLAVVQLTSHPGQLVSLPCYYEK